MNTIPFILKDIIKISNKNIVNTLGKTYYKIWLASLVNKNSSISKRYASASHSPSSLFLTLFFFVGLLLSSCESKSTTPSTPTNIEFTVTFDTDGGTAIEPIKVAKNKSITKPANPTKANYIFVNWFKDSAKTQVFDFTSETITAAITLYAKWEIITYTVTFNLNYDNAPDGGTLNTNQEGRVTKADPTRPSYTFNGWFTADTGGTRIELATNVFDASIILYAQWTKNPINVSMAWVSMREGLIQFDNGTQGVKTIGVIVR